MSRFRPSRRSVLAVLVCLTAGPGAAVASAAPPDRLALADIAGDANGLNDQGEGLVGNVATTWQVRQADLRNVEVGPLTDVAGQRRGLRVTVTTTARPAPLATGTPLAYGLVMQPHRDCRVVVEYLSRGASPTGQPVPAAARLIHSCDGGHYTEVELAAALQGRTVTIDVPYDRLPAQAQAGAEAHSLAAYVRTAPFGELNRGKPGEIDGTRTSRRYTFPG
jgi:hypothetical protein